jgi:hypothetical protein
MYGSWTHLLFGRRDAWQRSSGFGKAKAFKPRRTKVLSLVITAALMIVSQASAEELGEINVEGGWAYTARSDHGGIDHIATTRAAEDNIWFLLACSADERLTVSLLHPEQFPFPLKPSSQVKLRSNNVPTVSIEGKSIQNNQIFVDPRPMRHIMLPLLQDDQLVVSISERDGIRHDYTFSLQPNDVALRAIRLRCFGF